MNTYKNRLGERRKMHNGMYATIIAYRSAIDIDVQFEDGKIRESMIYRHFKEGRVAYSQKNITGECRVGERRKMNCGMYATIIKYRSSHDIDIKFDNSEIVKNKYYTDFKKGIITCKTKELLAKNRVGEQRKMNCGMYATIIAYRSSMDIDVQFDNGLVIKNKKYCAFKRGEIANKIINITGDGRLGERRKMNCGLYATIIAYRSSSDIDVELSNNIAVYNRTYRSFKNGEINYISRNEIGEGRVGERRKMNCGLYATIIAYRSSSDIDVQFENREIVKNKSYWSFKEGEIASKTIRDLNKKKVLDSRLGERRKMNCGLYATIVAYRNSKDIDVKFDNGQIEKNRTYNRFRIGEIACNNDTIIINSITIGRKINNVFACKCNKCHKEMLLTPELILKHKCSKAT